MEAPPGEITHWTGAALRPRSASVLASGARMGCNPTAFASSSSPRTLNRRQCATRRYTSIRRRTPCPVSTKKASGARPHPTRVADEEGRAGTMTHDYQRHGTTTVRRHDVSTRDRPQHAAPSPPGVHPFPQRGRAQVLPAKPSTPSSTITPSASIRPCGNGSRATHAGPSTSPRPRPPGSTPSGASSQSSPNAASNVGVFRRGRLQATINRFLDDHNAHSKPFEWVADPDKIIAAVRRGHQVLRSIHLGACLDNSGLWWRRLLELDSVCL